MTVATMDPLVMEDTQFGEGTKVAVDPHMEACTCRCVCTKTNAAIIGENLDLDVAATTRPGM